MHKIYERFFFSIDIILLGPIYVVCESTEHTYRCAGYCNFARNRQPCERTVNIFEWTINKKCSDANCTTAVHIAHGTQAKYAKQLFLRPAIKRRLVRPTQKIFVFRVY